MKKGDRVLFNDGSVKYGTVIRKKGKTLEVNIDGNYDSFISGPINLFKPSDKPVHKDPYTVMDNYSIKAWQEIEGHGDSRTFLANIYCGGRKIIRVSNDGRGGDNEYEEFVRGTREQLLKDLKEWATRFGAGDLPKYLLPGLWVEWNHFFKDLGKPAKQELSEWKELFCDKAGKA